MISRGAALVSGLLIATMLFAALWALMRVRPDAAVAIHFDLRGHPDGWSEPLYAFLVVPGAAAVAWLFFALLPRMDLRKTRLLRSERAYGTIWIAATLVLCILQGVIILRAMGAELPMSRWLGISIGALLMVLGNMMGKVRWNYTFGIRTRWTLSDERVWDKTHRFGGWAFVAGGALLLAATFALPPTVPVLALALAVLFVVSLATVVKSYRLSRANSS